jgi:hypothetical protein
MLAMAALLGVSAIAVDYGRWLVAKRDYQNIADGAVLAGAPYLRDGTDAEASLAREAAWAAIVTELDLGLDPATLAATNTPADGPVEAGGYRIWVDSPASAAGAKYPGRYGLTRTIYAHVEHDDRAFLGALLGAGDTTVAAWATAGRYRYRFGIEILCPMLDARCPGNVQDLKIAGGTHGAIRVVEGDVGSNWGLHITSNSAPGLLIEQGDMYVVEFAPGADWNPPPWTTGGINRGASPQGPNIYPEPMGGLLPVPDWPLPPWIGTTDGADCAASDCVPLRADVTCGTSGSLPPCGSVVEATSPALTCGPDAIHLAPGTYDSIDVRAGCVVLDPAPPGAKVCTETGKTPVPASVGLCVGQTPGIFRIRKSLSVGSGQSAAYLAGDGVTLVLDAGIKVSFGNSGALAVDVGNVLGSGTDWSSAAWTSDGVSPWPRCDAADVSATDPCVLPGAYGSTGPTGMGAAFFIRPEGVADLSGGCGPTIDSVTMNGSFGLEFKGALFAPCTNLSLGASPYQGTVGAVFAWTLNYNGQTELRITAIGPEVITPPYLLEPTLGQ